MCERNIILDFQGAISQDMLVGMAELLKNKSSLDNNSPFAKKLFSIFVEMAQNIAFYSAERVRIKNQKSSQEVGAGIIVVTEENKCYTITSGNLINQMNIPNLTEHCQKINNLDKDSLKLLFKDKIKSSRKAGEKGAGVGLIDVVRKSGHPIQFGITPVDNINSFLVLSVKLKEGTPNE